MGKKRRTAAQWLDTPLGKVVLERESALLRDALEQVFGLHTMQLGAWGPRDQFLQHCNTRRKSLVASYPYDGVDMVARPSELAVASDSVDIVILPHTLEFDAQPHDLLREVQRVLVGDGHVVLLGFNPFSTWGLGQRLGRIPASDGHAIGQRRLLDWLSLLGLEPVAAKRYLYTPPLNHKAVTARAARFEDLGSRYWPLIGGAYLVVAKKRVFGALPSKPAWYKPRLVVGGLVEPTTRNAA